MKCKIRKISHINKEVITIQKITHTGIQRTSLERKADPLSSITRGILVLLAVQIILGVLHTFLALLFNFPMDSVNNNLVIPQLFDLNYTLYGPLIFLATVLYFSKFIEGRSLRSLSLRRLPLKKAFITAGLSIALFTLLGGVIIAMMPISIVAHHLNFSIWQIVLVIGFFIYSFSQEVFFHGYLFNALAVEGNIGKTSLITAGLYTLFTANVLDFNVFEVLAVFLFGLAITFIHYISDYLILTTIIQACWNITFYLGFGQSFLGEVIPVSLFKIEPTTFDIHLSIPMIGALALINVLLYSRIPKNKNNSL